MRVAIVSPHPISPPDSGDRIRSHHLLRELLARGVDAQLAAYSWSPDEPERAATHYVPGRPFGTGPQALLWRARLAIARRSDPFAIHQRPALQARMRSLIDDIAPDVVDFQHSFTWMETGRPSVLTVHNVESQRLATFDSVSPRQYASAVRTERDAAVGADAVVVFSKLDAERLAAHASPTSLHVVPIGSDPGEPLPAPREQLSTVAYVGSFDYQPNVDAVELLRRMWPQIRAKSGATKLLVVGRRASAHFTSGGDFEVRSDVASVRDALVDADAIVVPLMAGGGVRVKIIEAFRLGIPVVSTPLGIEGLGAVAGVHAAVVDDLAGIPAALGEIAPVQRRAAMVGAAQSLWLDEFSPSRMAERMVEVYESVRR